ncbi:hypothetical protein [Nocardia aurantia]|uniref:Uncharacterized protein n=1 Tax=Nocardia aurantia TaxID=2585199 RepID=A0A7K0DN32_9NOCA|nr:hypothetical protein [Nocardia aurantia]MQY27028.1 hypothetical protein [Nocardia aurantia]
MATSFDPAAWSPSRALGLGRRLLDPEWLEHWAAATTAWLDPVADPVSGTVTALLPDALMSALSHGIVRRFGGAEFSATLLGRELTATLYALRASRRGAHFHVEATLTGVRWSGHPIREATVVAHGVRLVPGVPTRVRAAGLEITGTIALDVLLDRVNRRDPDWELTPGPVGPIRARHRRRRIRAVLDAVVGDNLLSVAVHRATWWGIRVPRRYLRIPSRPLPGLPHDVRVERADRDGDVVRFRVTAPAVSGSFDLAAMRSAIVAGTTMIIF